jgi:hypothetical protein
MSGENGNSNGAKSFDIGFQLEESARLEPIMGPDGAPMDGVWIDVYGSDSQIHQDAADTINQRRLSQAVVTGSLAAVRAKALVAERIELLARCTKAWGGLTQAGEPFACTFANAVSLYSKHRWLADQVAAFKDQRASFLPKPSESSAIR